MGQNLDDFPNLKRWFESIRSRPAVAKGFAVGSDLRNPGLDDEAKKILFGQTSKR